MKWNAKSITDFLLIYEEFPLLWNIKDKDYLNIKLKKSVFEELTKRLEEKGLVGNMNVKQLKAKIKTIKDVYRQEVNKIEKSKKSGTSPDEIYWPKLVWFDSAHFLRECVSTRYRKSNLDDTVDVAINENEMDMFNSMEQLSETNFYIQGGSDTSGMTSPTNNVRKKMKTLSKQSKKLKRPVSMGVEEAIQKLNCIAPSTTEDKPYDAFAKYVAAELRALPNRQAILLQQQIQNNIINYKLSYLEEISRISSPNPSSASSSSSYNPIEIITIKKEA